MGGFIKTESAAPPSEDLYKDFESRTCATCAVSFLITPPRIDTRTRLEKDSKPLPIPAPIRICRLEPPKTAFDANGQAAGYVQQPVYDANVCWHWRRPGTLPGD